MSRGESLLVQLKSILQSPIPPPRPNLLDAEQQTRCPESIRQRAVALLCYYLLHTRRPNVLLVMSIRPARPRQQQRLLGSALEERDEVVALLGLLHAGEGHLGAGYVLFRVLEVVELQLPSVVGQCTAPVSINARSTYQSVLAPGDALGLVCIRVGKARHLARLAAEEAVQLGSDLVALASSQRMALRASRLLAWLHPIMS
jgi:hypothetical protein